MHLRDTLESPPRRFSVIFCASFCLNISLGGFPANPGKSQEMLFVFQISSCVHQYIFFPEEISEAKLR